MKYNKESVKQVLLITVAIILIFMGYFNYSLDINIDKENIAKEERNEHSLGDVQLVNAEPSLVANNDIVPNEEVDDNGTTKEIINNVNENKYYEETKLERNRMYSEMLESYQNLIDSPETPQDQKAIAAKEISNINKRKNGLMIAENLIKNKGFEDVVILVNDNIVSVVVKSYILNQEQISKIQNIVERELDVEIKNINISNRYWFLKNFLNIFLPKTNNKLYEIKFHINYKKEV